MTPVLQLESVACRRGDRLLFSGLDAALGAGELMWLRGSNGRGKTSLLRLVAGLALPEEGRVLWRGQPVRRGAGYGGELLYIAHGNALKDDLTAAESLAFLARVHGRAADADDVRRALERLGLGSRARSPVRTLSQGQRRRVTLARLALAPPAALWVLDEPFDALDATSAATLHELLDGQRASGGSVLLTSHHLPVSGQEKAPARPLPRTLDLDLLPVPGRSTLRAGSGTGLPSELAPASASASASASLSVPDSAQGSPSTPTPAGQRVDRAP